MRTEVLFIVLIPSGNVISIFGTKGESVRQALEIIYVATSFINASRFVKLKRVGSKLASICGASSSIDPRVLLDVS